MVRTTSTCCFLIRQCWSPEPAPPSHLLDVYAAFRLYTLTISPEIFCLTQAEQVSLIVFPYHPLIYSVSTGLCYQVIPSRVWASGDSIGPILVPQGLSSVSHIGDVHGVAVLMTGWMNERVSQGRQRCGDVWRLGEAMCKQLWVCFSG